VNEELNHRQHSAACTRWRELEVANSDLRNLLASNEVATLCLDRSFRIKWFTPAAHRCSFIAERHRPPDCRSEPRRDGQA